MWKQVGLGFLSLASSLTEARRWMVNVASLRKLRRFETEDRQVDAIGCVGPFYHKFVIFYVLDHRGILVFYSFTWVYK
jgi:hypothetical protein